MPFWSRTWADDGAILDQAAVDEAEADEAALVAAARDDPAAFTALYHRYFRPVYRYCYLRLGSHEAAEDATSDTFLKALAGLDKYRNQSFAAWLFRIAHNTVVDAQRRKRPQAPIEDAEQVMDTAPTPEDRALAHASNEDLRTTLAQLTDEQRSVMELQLAGWNSVQIGQALGRSAGTIRMIRFRAFNKLREILGEQATEGDEEVRNGKR